MARKHIHTKPQTFSITAPDAVSVTLVGSFTHWEERPIPLKQQQPGGVWQAAVQLPPGTYHYRFIVDGEWCDDPACTVRVPNPYGTQDSVRQVS